jgi:hypothetical protein
MRFQVSGSGYFRVSGIGVLRSSKARRWVGVGIAIRSKPDVSLPATRIVVQTRQSAFPISNGPASEVNAWGQPQIGAWLSILSVVQARMR